MASIQASNAIPMTQLTVAAASITGSYTVIGKFTGPLIEGYVISTMDAAVQLSFDGVHDHLVSPIGNTVPSVVPLNFKANLTCLPTPSVSVKTIGTPSTGNLYICGFTAQTP